MKCPDCQTALPDGSKFWNECGKKLEIACPECLFMLSGCNR